MVLGCYFTYFGGPGSDHDGSSCSGGSLLLTSGGVGQKAAEANALQSKPYKSSWSSGLIVLLAGVP